MIRLRIKKRYMSIIAANSPGESLEALKSPFLHNIVQLFEDFRDLLYRYCSFVPSDGSLPYSNRCSSNPPVAPPSEGDICLNSNAILLLSTRDLDFVLFTVSRKGTRARNRCVGCIPMRLSNLLIALSKRETDSCWWLSSVFGSCGKIKE